MQQLPTFTSAQQCIDWIAEQIEWPGCTVDVVTHRHARAQARSHRVLVETYRCSRWSQRGDRSQIRNRHGLNDVVSGSGGPSKGGAADELDASVRDRQLRQRELHTRARRHGRFHHGWRGGTSCTDSGQSTQSTSMSAPAKLCVGTTRNVHGAGGDDSGSGK